MAAKDSKAVKRKATAFKEKPKPEVIIQKNDDKSDEVSFVKHFWFKIT